jgi:hypothetical protein
VKSMPQWGDREADEWSARIPTRGGFLLKKPKARFQHFVRQR